MARRRPELEGYAGIALNNLASTRPRDWVAAVMSSLGEKPPGPPGSPIWYADWSYAEIREAIRREYERRGKSGLAAMRAANLTTARGLSELRRLGAIKAKVAKLHLSEGYPITDWLSESLMRIGMQAAERRRMIKSPPVLPFEPAPPDLMIRIPPGWAIASSWLGPTEPGFLVAYHFAPVPMSPEMKRALRREMRRVAHITCARASGAGARRGQRERA